MERPANPRTIALAGAVLLATALPLAVAGAGPAGDAGEAVRPVAAAGSGLGSGPGAHPASADAASAAGPSPGPSPGLSLDVLGLPPLPGAPRADEAGTAASCGPALGTGEGFAPGDRLEVQTCVVREGARLRARSHHRNATREPLLLVLTLMGPDGRSVQVRCPLPARAGGGTCETPPLAGAGTAGAGAVAEVASSDGSRLVMRSGSNAGDGRGAADS